MFILSVVQARSMVFNVLHYFPMISANLLGEAGFDATFFQHIVFLAVVHTGATNLKKDISTHRPNAKAHSVWSVFCFFGWFLLARIAFEVSRGLIF